MASPLEELDGWLCASGQWTCSRTSLAPPGHYACFCFKCLLLFIQCSLVTAFQAGPSQVAFIVLYFKFKFLLSYSPDFHDSAIVI